MRMGISGGTSPLLSCLCEILTEVDSWGPNGIVRRKLATWPPWNGSREGSSDGNGDIRSSVVTPYELLV
jgi:hypothetical protein